MIVEAKSVKLPSPRPLRGAQRVREADLDGAYLDLLGITDAPSRPRPGGDKPDKEGVKGAQKEAILGALSMLVEADASEEPDVLDLAKHVIKRSQEDPTPAFRAALDIEGKVARDPYLAGRFVETRLYDDKRFAMAFFGKLSPEQLQALGNTYYDLSVVMVPGQEIEDVGTSDLTVLEGKVTGTPEGPEPRKRKLLAPGDTIKKGVAKIAAMSESLVRQMAASDPWYKRLRHQLARSTGHNVRIPAVHAERACIGSVPEGRQPALRETLRQCGWRKDGKGLYRHPRTPARIAVEGCGIYYLSRYARPIAEAASQETTRVMIKRPKTLTVASLSERPRKFKQWKFAEATKNYRGVNNAWAAPAGIFYPVLPNAHDAWSMMHTGEHTDGLVGMGWVRLIDREWFDKDKATQQQKQTIKAWCAANRQEAPAWTLESEGDSAVQEASHALDNHYMLGPPTGLWESIGGVIGAAKERIKYPAQITDIGKVGRFVALSALPTEGEASTDLTLADYKEHGKADPIIDDFDVLAFLRKVDKVMDGLHFPQDQTVIMFSKMPANLSNAAAYVMPALQTAHGMSPIFANRKPSASATGKYASWGGPRSPHTIVHEYAHQIYWKMTSAQRQAIKAFFAAKIADDAQEARKTLYAPTDYSLTSVQEWWAEIVGYAMYPDRLHPDIKKFIKDVWASKGEEAVPAIAEPVPSPPSPETEGANLSKQAADFLLANEQVLKQYYPDYTVETRPDGVRIVAGDSKADHAGLLKALEGKGGPFELRLSKGSHLGIVLSLPKAGHTLAATKVADAMALAQSVQKALAATAGGSFVLEPRGKDGARILPKKKGKDVVAKMATVLGFNTHVPAPWKNPKVPTLHARPSSGTHVGLVLESGAPEEGIKDQMVPGKSVLIGNQWWTIAKRDIPKNVVALTLSSFAIKDGVAPQKPKVMSWSSFVSKCQAGTYGFTVRGKHYGPEQKRSARATQRKRAGLSKAPGTPKAKE